MSYFPVSDRITSAASLWPARDETISALPGTTLNVPPDVWHEAGSTEGARLLTIFSPGGFDRYLEELVSLGESQYGDADLMKRLAEKYDIFEA